MQKKKENDYAIVTELVDISEIDNIKNYTKTKEKLRNKKDAAPIKKAESKIPEEEKEHIKEDVKKDPEPQKELASKKEIKKIINDKSEKLPDKKKKEEKKQIKSETQPEKEKKQDKPKKDQKKNDEKKKEEPKKKKQKQADGKSALKSLESRDAKEYDDTLDKIFQDIDHAETNKDFKNDLAISITEKNLLRSHIQKHWNKSSFSGADSMVPMVASIVVTLDISGNIKSLKLVSKSGTSDRYYSAFTSSIEKAVWDSAPFDFLSKNTYQDWQDLELTFNSTEGAVSFSDR